MSAAREMQVSAKPHPRLMQTIQSVMSLVRHSREAPDAPVPPPGTAPVDVAELIELFSDAVHETEARAAARRVPAERQETADRHRLRAALYDRY